MEEGADRVLDAVGTALEVELRHGPIRRIASAVLFRKAKNQPADQVDYREEAVKAALENAVETIRSQDYTIAQSFQIVDRVVTYEDLDKLNSTWQSHWSEGASKVGLDDEERRTWWARLLAGEMQQPGTFSLRTMAVMDTLSTKEARLFTRLCDYVWNPADALLILPKDESALWKPDFAEATILESIGLAKFDALSGFTWGTAKTSPDDKTIQQLPPVVPMTIGDDAFLVTGPIGTSVTLRCGTLLITDVGKEMYKLTTPNLSQAYLDEILVEWRQSHTVQQMSTIKGQGL